jgi:hypothetical protein
MRRQSARPSPGPAWLPSGTGPTDAVLGGLLGEYATGIGEIKFALDLAAFVGAVTACAAGWAH